MRSLIRYIATLLFTGVAIVVGTVFRQNIETAATDAGIDSILKRGWDGMTSTGYEMWLLFGFSFLGGVTATLWIDWAIRRWQRGPKRYRIARAGLNFPKDDLENFSVQSGDWMDFAYLNQGNDLVKSWRDRDPKLTKFGANLTLVFTHDIEPPLNVYVTSNRTVLYEITDRGDRFVHLNLDLRSKEELNLEIRIQSDSRFGGSGDHLDRWEESMTFSTEHKFFEPVDIHNLDKSIIPPPKRGQLDVWEFGRPVSLIERWRPQRLLRIARKKLRRSPHD